LQFRLPRLPHYSTSVKQNRVRFVCTIMPKGRTSILVSAVIALMALVRLGEVLAATAAAPPSYGQWKNGPGTDANYFPIAVWLQDPKNAERFKSAGINLYVGLYRGPTSNQLDALGNAGMRVICGQGRGLEHKENPIIVGWMHGDEPDNAQSLGQGKGYGPPILPEKIVADYERLRAADPTRPILLNLGQGVAWDNYIGRGVRRNHPEDYPEYLKGCDIGSFDIYPVVHDNAAVSGKLEFVAHGVQRVREWTRGEKPVWNCIECTHISNVDRKATPEQVRAEVWMSLIHGSRGLVYFVHQFKPVFKEAALLDDPEMLSAVTAINRQIQELAPVLNSPTVANVVWNHSSPASVPVASTTKRHENRTYLFTVAMRRESTRSAFKIDGLAENAVVEVLGEVRTLTARKGEFSDDFKPYGVHLYRVGSPK